MKRKPIYLMLIILIMLAGVCFAQAEEDLDQYGGSTKLKCSQATGYFRTEKIGDRWWLCTPLGNAFFSISLGGVIAPGDGCDPSTGQCNRYNEIIKQKYGDPAVLYWGPQQNRRLLSWGFNTYGQISSAWGAPYQTDGRWPGDHTQPVKLPVMPYVWTLHSMTNLHNYAAGPAKDVMYGLNSNYKGWRGSSLIDYYDNNVWQWLDGNLRNSYAKTNNPYTLLLLGDDTDWVISFGAGPDFPTTPVGNTSADAGWITLISSPVQIFNATKNVLYADTKVYTKTASGAAPVNCDINTPCTLRDFLYKKYSGNIQALNQSWGSNYTIFDSTGIPVVGEVIGTGDGQTTVFRRTLSRALVSPLSIQVFESANLQAGDCPWGSICNPPNSYTGVLSAPSGRTNLQTGVTLWLSSIYGQPDANYPKAAYSAIITYHFPDGSGSVSALSRRVGEGFYTSGQKPFVTSPSADPQGKATGYDVYMACQYHSSYTGPFTFGCAASSGSFPDLTLQASNVPIGTDWSMPQTGLITGAPLPPPVNYIDYTSGAIQVTFITPPAAGAPITVNYIYNGWMSGGTGLMDENGSNAWVGTSYTCLLPASQCPANRVNANPNLGRDLYEWDAQFSAQYHKNFRAALQRHLPNILFFGADSFGTWGAPPRKEMLQGAAPYLDGIFIAFVPTQETIDYLEQYLGDKPIYLSIMFHATPDSALWRYGKPSHSLQTQQARGEVYLSRLNEIINFRATPTNSYPFLGANWWGLVDFWNEKLNWGLVSLNDNPYDGKSAVAAQGVDEWGYPTGGEERNYGDAISYIKQGNALWYEKAGLSSATVKFPFVPAGASYPPVTTPLPPTILSFTASPLTITSGQSSTLSWSVSGASSLSINQGVGTVTGLTSKSVSPVVTTTYTLTAVNAQGSATRTVTVTLGSIPIDVAAPTVPTGLTTVAVSSSQINLSWTASTDNVGVAGYKVFRLGTQIATVNSGTTYSDTGLSPSISYSYTVSAYDAAGNVSEQSVSVTATTPTSSILYGDVSENGVVSAYDASLTAQYTVGLITLTSGQIIKADVSGNASVSAYDASLIAQYAVGLITRFPVEG